MAVVRAGGIDRDAVGETLRPHQAAEHALGVGDWQMLPVQTNSTLVGLAVFTARLLRSASFDKLRMRI